MNANERRIQLLELLVERRHDNINNLAFEFDVSVYTIMRDVQMLSLSYPIYTTQGKGGGVHVVDGYRMGRKYLTQQQEDLLARLGARLTGEDFKIMQAILHTFKEPKRG